MATVNLLDEVTPKLIAMGLMALRTTCVMPRLVNRDYDTIAQQKGSTVDVTIPSAVVVNEVAPQNISPSTQALAPTSIPLVLSEWKEAPFFLTDKDMKQAMEGLVPMQVSEAVAALAVDANAYILNQYKDIGTYHGVYGTGVNVELFISTATDSGTKDANTASKLLNINKAPRTDRRFVIDPQAEAQALNLRAFQDMSFNGADYGIKEGTIHRKLGFDWFMDQQIPVHTTTATGYTTSATAVTGATSLSVTGTHDLVQGDVFYLTGQTPRTQYAVTSVNTDSTAINIRPALTGDVASAQAMVIASSHTVNLAFHRDCIAFATRPLEDEGTGFGNMISAQTDPVSGLSLRLEISREHKRSRFSFDMLYGAAVVRPELGCRVAGAV